MAGVLDVVSENGQCFIVSDFVDGISLSKWIGANQPDWRTTAQICASIADALAHAHAHRTVHRDLKPANVIMTSGNLPVIVDFGLSVSDVQRAEGTARGEISGTPTYMSPEQAAGAGHRIDGRTEIYALGVILYRMLTGRLPFDSSSMMDLLRQVQEDEPQPPRQLNRHLPVEMERICLKAMAKSLKERYTTADDLAFELRQAIAGIGLAATANPAINSSLLASSATIHRPSVAELSPSDSVVGGAASESRRGKPSSSQSFDEHVSGSESSRSTPTSSRRRSVSQRRQVTIVSCGCDVFENETIQECLDADEQAGVLQGFQKLCREVAAKFNGSVLQDTDDGIAVCFGFPQAFEDSVSRAVRFGLAVLHKMVEHNRTLQTQKVRLSSRIVMHTDVAVVESQANSEDALSVSVVGTIRNYTSRLEQVAELDSLLVPRPRNNLPLDLECGLLDFCGAGDAPVRWAEPSYGLRLCRFAGVG
ncbi:MAG: protein kinase, partial [Planctomycetia bacterium]|nr:protein kinase [Planctomycetia bacterium]